MAPSRSATCVTWSEGTNRTVASRSMNRLISQGHAMRGPVHLQRCRPSDSDADREDDPARERQPDEGTSRDVDRSAYLLFVWSRAAFNPPASRVASSVAQKCM